MISDLKASTFFSSSCCLGAGLGTAFEGAAIGAFCFLLNKDLM